MFRRLVSCRDLGSYPEVVKECVPLKPEARKSDPSNPTDRSRIVLDVLGFQPLPLASQRTVSQWTTPLGNAFLFPELWAPIPESPKR